jgi:hypothetical protein
MNFLVEVNEYTRSPDAIPGEIVQTALLGVAKILHES